ncbi:MAG: flavin reductase family protein [Oscillospiraceae bacterium]
MNDYNKISPKELNQNPFTMFHKDWALITAGTIDSYNTMTASWGGVGVLWNKDVATIYIRPQRYTYEFIEKNELFTISIFPEDYKKALNFCGKFSGRDYDKAKEADITPVEVDGSTTFKEARLVFVCKKLYHSDINPEHFYDREIEKNYTLKDYHRMYIGEIVSAYIKCEDQTV